MSWEDSERRLRAEILSRGLQKQERVACLAYEETYQGERKWNELNPQVRWHWIQITAAVMAALQSDKT